MLEDFAPERIRELLIRFSLESACVLACVLGIYFRAGVKQLLARLGPWRATICIVFVAAFTLTQLVDRWQYHFPARLSFYPLARFAMYQTGQPSEYVTSYKFEGRFNGRYEEINLTKQFSAIGLPSLNTRFRVLSSKLLSDDRQDVNWAERQLTDYCRSMIRLRHARGEPLPSEVRFVVKRYDVRSGYQQLTAQSLREFRFSMET